MPPSASPPTIMHPRYMNRARAINPWNPANPSPPPLPPRDSIFLPAYTDAQIAFLQGTYDTTIPIPPMPVPSSRIPGGLMPVAPAPAPAPTPATVLHIGNQNPSALATRNQTRVTANFHRRAEAKELSQKLYSGPNTNLGKVINTVSDTLLYRFHLGLIDNHGQPIDSEGCRIPRPPRPARKFRYTEYKKPKKTSSLRCRKAAQNRSASSLIGKMRDEGKLSFSIAKNWRDFHQIERFSARIDFQDMIDRSTTYMYEREKKQFYSDPKNQDKPFYPRYLPIVISRTKDIDDWRIKTGPNGQLIQPQIVMPSLSSNK